MTLNILVAFQILKRVFEVFYISNVQYVSLSIIIYVYYIGFIGYQKFERLIYLIYEGSHTLPRCVDNILTFLQVHDSYLTISYILYLQC